MSTAHVRGATASRTLRQSNGGWLRPAPTLAALTLTSALLVGCTSSGEASGEQSATSAGLRSDQATSQSVANVSDRPMTVEEAVAQNHDYWTVDEDVRAAQQPQTITLKDTGAAISSSSSGVSIEPGVVTITEAGTYTITGAYQGQLVVDAGDDAQVTLIFDDVSIDNAAGPAVLLSSADGVEVQLAAGSQNSISDAATYAEDADEDAALFSHVDLNITGEGSLEVTGNGSDGIASKDDLVITGGSLTVTAADDGLRGKDALVITGGDVDVTSIGDGLKTTNEDEADRGYFLISDGNVTIEAGDDGIDVISDALFSGGTVTVTGSVEGVEAQNILVGGGILDVTSSDDGLNATVGSTTTEETADAATAAPGAGQMGGASMGDDGSNLVLYGGTVTIDAQGDGIDSNGNLTISGGEITVFGTSSGGNGAFDVNGTFTLSGGDVLALSAGQMEQTPSVVEQAFVSTTASGSEAVTITANNAALRDTAAPRAFGYVFYSSPDLAEGDVVTVSTGSSSVEATATLEGGAMGMGGPGQMGGQGQMGEPPSGTMPDGGEPPTGEPPAGGPGGGTPEQMGGTSDQT